MLAARELRLRQQAVFQLETVVVVPVRWLPDLPVRRPRPVVTVGPV
jgi:hypothetical protein